MWRREQAGFALLELWATGRLHRRQAQGDAWDELARLPWTRRTGRRDELVLDEAHRDDLLALLTRSVPDWRALLGALRASGLTPDARGVKQLRQLQRGDALPDTLPEQLNQRTATAALAAHSKATLGDDLRERLGDTAITHDGLLRLRPHAGLRVVRGAQDHDAVALAECLGELVLSERALRGGTRLAGRPPRALLLAENVGFYIDVPAPRGWLIAHVPGWDTAPARLLLRETYPEIPAFHCGDLDPNGVRIYGHLRALRPDLRWVVPPFWEEQLALRAQRGAWPEGLVDAHAPALVTRLATEGRWLEQEPLALDPRLPEYLEGLLAPPRP